MRIDDAKHLMQKSIVEAAVNEAVSALPILQSMRGGSTPDDSGSGGYFEDDVSGVLTYSSWFGPGDMPNVKLLRPF